jgi:hypothetical protein
VSNPTLLDLQLRQDPDGRIARRIIEQLSQTDGALDDMTFEECNDGSGHLTTIRTGLPDATWRQLYQGVQPSNSTTAQVRDATGMLEMRSEIDVKAAQQAGGNAAWRETEEMPFRQKLKNEVMATWLYGNESTAPAKFTGVFARFNSLSAANADNIIDAAGVGSDNTSILIHTWHPLYGTMIYPRGSNAGLTARDLGEQDSFDSNSRRFRAFHTLYGWDTGYSLRDWRGVVRICNIDVSDLTKNASAGADLVDLIVRGLELLPEEATALGRVSIYCNRTIRSFLRRQINNKANNWLTTAMVGGKKVLTFDDLPVRRCDSILNTEARVV